MSVLISGRTMAFVLLISSIIIIMYMTNLVSKGKKYTVKKSFPALDAISEAIGRAVELGRPVHYTPGYEALSGSRGTHSQVGMIIGGYVTRLCIQMGAKLTWSVSGNLYPIAREIYRSALIAENLHDVEPDVRFHPRGAGAFGTACIETMAQEDSATNLMFGGFGSEFPIVAEGGFRVGAFQIGGCSNPRMVPLVVAACDYSMIGEENFAASAMLSGDQEQLAGIISLDLLKVFIVSLILLGSLLRTTGIDVLTNILKL